MGEQKRETKDDEREHELLRSASMQLGRVARIGRFADLMALLMVTATLFSAYAAWRTAQVATLLFTISERPFLGVQNVSFEVSKPEKPTVIVEFRNFGHIPAVGTKLDVHALLDGKPIQPTRGGATLLDAGVVSPTVPHYFYAFIPANAYEKVVEGTAHMTVAIRMAYEGPELGRRYCYFEKFVYHRPTASFELNGGTTKCSGDDVY